MEVTEATGIKQLFAGMMPSQPGVIEGKVMSADPIEIALVNDEKVSLSGGSLTVPQHLTDYSVPASIAGGEISEPECTITFKSGLQPGETVYLLSFSEGKQYYVLGRKGG